MCAASPPSSFAASPPASSPRRHPARAPCLAASLLMHAYYPEFTDYRELEQRNTVLMHSPHTRQHLEHQNTTTQQTGVSPHHRMTTRPARTQRELAAHLNAAKPCSENADTRGQQESQRTGGLLGQGRTLAGMQRAPFDIIHLSRPVRRSEPR